jgi:hemerythrin-like domain-containing protein
MEIYEAGGTRRRFIMLSAAGVAGAAVLGIRSGHAAEEKEVTPNEDLMREHGVLRRALIIYAVTAPEVRKSAPPATLQALQKTASLFQTFGEDYHEKRLEETHVFPVVRKVKSPAAAYPDVLVQQHNRGREITNYILAATRRGQLAPDDAQKLATCMEQSSSCT